MTNDDLAVTSVLSLLYVVDGVATPGPVVRLLPLPPGDLLLRQDRRPGTLQGTDRGIVSSSELRAIWTKG